MIVPVLVTAAARSGFWGVWETDVGAYDWDTSTSWTGYTSKQNVGCPGEN